jgi:hypothetical protein
MSSGAVGQLTIATTEKLHGCPAGVVAGQASGAFGTSCASRLVGLLQRSWWIACEYMTRHARTFVCVWEGDCSKSGLVNGSQRSASSTGLSIWLTRVC